MNLLFAAIGVLMGGALGYWWRSREVIRALPSNAVWLFPIKGSAADSPTWRIELQETHDLFQPEPTLWTLPIHEHRFTLKEKHSIKCKKSERVDVSCLVRVQPKRDPELLSDLLTQSSLEQINEVTWVFEHLQAALRTSTTVFQLHTRSEWLSNPTALGKAWQDRIDASLPHWTCTIQILSLQATDDQFYDQNDPNERNNLLQRTQQLEDLASIEERIRRIELRSQEEKVKQAQLEANIAQTEQLEIKWSALEQHLQKKQSAVARDVQERIEEYRINAREKLGSITEERAQVQKLRTPTTEQLNEELQERNQIDTLLDTEKVNELALITSLEAESLVSQEIDAQPEEKTATTPSEQVPLLKVDHAIPEECSSEMNVEEKPSSDALSTDTHD